MSSYVDEPSSNASQNGDGAKSLRESEVSMTSEAMRQTMREHNERKKERLSLQQERLQKK